MAQNRSATLPQLTEARFYAIVDLAYVGSGEVPRTLEQLIEGGADLVQLRGKTQSAETLTDVAKGMVQIAGETKTPVIINDHPEVAVNARAQGVHVGQDDEKIASVRASVDHPIVVGKSTHSVAQAVVAEREGADYIGFGPLFATPTKPDYAPIGLAQIREVHEKVTIPIFCIGGIHIDNLQQVIDAGAKRVVMVSAVLRAHCIVDYVRCATDMLA